MTSRVYGYVRTSTGEQDLGIDKQKKEIEEHCDAQGYELLGIQAGKESGMNELVTVSKDGEIDKTETPSINLDERPTVKKAFMDVQGVKAEKLIVYNPSRLARSMRSLKILEYIFDSVGCEVEYIDVPNDWIGKNIMSLVYEWEARQTRKRTREALDRKKENDEWLGRPPTGFRTLEDHNKLEPEPWLEILVRAVERYRNESLSRREIAEGYGPEEVTPSRMRSLEKNMAKDRPNPKYVKGKRPY